MPDFGPFSAPRRFAGPGCTFPSRRVFLPCAELFRSGRRCCWRSTRPLPLLFMDLVPSMARLSHPVVALATYPGATIIASQAVISGVFSITQQAVQLGQLPRIGNPPHQRDGSRPDYVPRSNAMAGGRRIV